MFVFLLAIVSYDQLLLVLILYIVYYLTAHAHSAGPGSVGLQGAEMPWMVD